MDVSIRVLYASVLAGAVSSAYVLRACSIGSPRLLKRQLFHQALATLPIDIAKAALMTWVLASSGVDADCAGDPLDRTVVQLHRQLAHAGFFATWLFDVHIAASVTAASLHAPAVLKQLGRWLLLVWLLAAVYGIHAASAASVADRTVINHDPIGALIVVVLFLTTVILYLIALAASWRSNSPNSVIIRTRRRTMVYPLIFIVTVFPTILRYLSVQAFYVCEQPGGTLSLVLEHSTVTLNAIAFYLTTGGRTGERRQVELAEGTGPPRGAQFVGFAAQIEVVEFATGTNSFRRPAQWMQRGDSLDLEVMQAEEAMWADYAGPETDTN